jgi:hypothetical protein
MRKRGAGARPGRQASLACDGAAEKGRLARKAVLYIKDAQVSQMAGAGCQTLYRSVELDKMKLAAQLKGMPMLELRPGCECCDRDLPPSSEDARICSYECTFCVDCAETILRGVCPNCGGNLVPRPIRPTSMLTRHPASAKRVVKADNCLSRAAE